MMETTCNDVIIIRQIMREKGITVNQLAQKTGVSQPSMSTTLAKGNMTVSSLRAIAKALEVEIADLFAVPANYQHYSIRNNNPKEDGAMEEVEQKQTLGEGGAQDCAATPELSPMRTMFCPKCGTKFLVEDVH